MTRPGAKRTVIALAQMEAARNRPGFVAVHQYGTLTPEPGEIGGIFRRPSQTRLERGLWTVEAECVERIFVAGDGA